MLDSRPASQSAKSRPAWTHWFYNLSIGRKQLFALTLCELVPIVGFGIGSTIVLTNSLRTQLLSQAKSELAVTETNYNIKINQMGFGSRGQSDNPIVITAAKNHQNNQAPPPELQKILQNEIKARRMEYATLVGKDLKIIANANNSRSKETISSPKLATLIQQVLKDGNQIKANEIVTGDELRKEAPPLPDGFKPQDALIRYVITPVRDPDKADNILGVLVFGDVANRKLPIVENTLNAFGGGYSAIYLRRENGEFSLVSSLTKSGVQQAQVDIALSDPAILKSAIAARNEATTQRIEIAGQMHTVAVRPLPNRIVETPDRSMSVNDEQATAIIVRGTPEVALNQLLWSSMQQEGIVLALALAAIAAWTALFRRVVLKPIQDLQQTTEAFANGHRDVRASIYAADEVGKLAIAFNRMAESIRSSELALESEVSRQEQQTKEAKALSEMTARMRRSFNPTQILQTAIDEIRDFLNLDRVTIYDFQHRTLEAHVTHEAIATDQFSILNKSVPDPLGLGQVEPYNIQSAWVIKDSATEVNETYQQKAADLNIKAEIIVPLKQNDQITGFVCAQQCKTTRDWKLSEINFLTQLVTQIGYALDQASLLQDRQSALQDAETRKDSLQQQIIQLLGEVQNVSAGDLTVRANVSSGDLGIVADFFNAIVENLRDIVVKVKQSSLQVNELLSKNETEVESLASQARKQAQETIRTLDSVEEMTVAMQAVADRAQKAAIAAENATQAAESGETVMDTTVTNIYSLRATVEEATRKVKQLGDSSQQVGRVVSLINDLATQTDLLAINASLEATRAGEHGRGFSIVANEIAELASRSADATREIKVILENIQAQTSEVVDTMTQGASQAVESAHSARNAKQSFLHVVQVSQQMDQLVKSISETMATQAVTSRSVTHLIKEVAEVSNLTSDSSLRVSTALRQTVDVAEELQSSVGMFKVQAGDRAG